MSYCCAGLCSSVLSRFLSSILAFDYKSTLQSILKGNNCGNLPSVNRYETGPTVSKQLENQFLKTHTLVLCIFPLPSTPSSVHSLGILSLWGFLTSASVLESTQNALCERKPLAVDLGQAAVPPSAKDAQSLKGREV